MLTYLSYRPALQQTLKANKDLGEELAEKIVHQVSTIYHELARPTANDGDNSGHARGSVVRYTKYVPSHITPYTCSDTYRFDHYRALTDAQDTLIRLSQRGLLGKSLLRGRDRRELLRMISAVDTEFNAFMVSRDLSQSTGTDV